MSFPPSSRLSEAPDAIRYLEELKIVYRDDTETLSRVLRHVYDWIWRDESLSLDLAAAILLVAPLLRRTPRLLYGFNALLKDEYRLECATDINEVYFFVLITPSGARIHSTTNESVPRPASPEDLSSFVSSPEVFNALLERNASVDWLTCLAQLLQFELDNQRYHPNNAHYRRRLFRSLQKLASLEILPPSLFLSNIVPDGPAIGGGAFADIYRGLMAGKPVCLKVLRMFSTPPQAREKVYKEFSQEILVWRQLMHPNVLPFLGASKDIFRPKYTLILQYMTNGNIMDYLHKYPHHDRLTSICEIAAGIQYLHGLDPPVTHKDIKGTNVLVKDDLSVCIGDFGLASIVETQRLSINSSTQNTGGAGGSMCWLAPELMDPSRFPKQSLVLGELAGDVYAFACTIYEIYSGKPPLADRPCGAAIMYAVLDQVRPSLPPEAVHHHWNEEEEGDIWPLVKVCWSHDPADRPRMQTICQELIRIKQHREVLRSRPTSMWDEGGPSPYVEPVVGRSEVKKWLDKELAEFSYRTSVDSDIIARFSVDRTSQYLEGLASHVPASSALGLSLRAPQRKEQEPVVLHNSKSMLQTDNESDLHTSNSGSKASKHSRLLPSLELPQSCVSNGLATPVTPSFKKLEHRDLPQSGREEKKPNYRAFPTPPATPLPTYYPKRQFLPSTDAPSHLESSSSLPGARDRPILDEDAVELLTYDLPSPPHTPYTDSRLQSRTLPPLTSALSGSPTKPSRRSTHNGHAEAHNRVPVPARHWTHDASPLRHVLAESRTQEGKQSKVAHSCARLSGPRSLGSQPDSASGLRSTAQSVTNASHARAAPSLTLKAFRPVEESDCD
ncbi:kinase-like domain-containing protein [Crucibulum laeve]|uniref:Kinase-like domain-containing protein n=1 Tax=Crucibulum laeve TaxID=68775 RepID=A0A5C3M2L8_9AGAR|nr:kinase-like domain-containing protein [Crucibulum laeve]